MIKNVPLFPITLIAVYLSGGLNVGFIIANMESKPRKMRKPNWTEEQCLLLVHLVEEHLTIIKEPLS